MTVDPALLPHLEQQLGTLSRDVQAADAAARALANWAGGADPALGGAAQTLSRASRALGDTSTRLDAMRRDVSQRASLLAQKPSSGRGAVMIAARRGDMGRDDEGLDFDDWYSWLGVRDGVFGLGFGWLHAEMGKTDNPEVEEGSRIDILTAEAKTGLLNPDTDTFGLAASAQVASVLWNMGHNSLGLRSVEMNIGRLQAEASVGADGATVGYGASAWDVAATFGQPSKDSGTDTQVRLGAGVGGGGAARLHWSDDDHDGDREYGFGFDAKAFVGVSFDMKTEALDDLALAAMGGGKGERRLIGHHFPDLKPVSR